MSIFISTGELSGDLYAAKLAAAFHRCLPEEHLWGMAGELAAGVRREWNNDSLHIFGLGRILTSLPRLFRLRDSLAEAVVRRNPSAVIVIDSPDFHIPLLGRIRKLGYQGPAVYVCPPTIWAWRSGRAKYLKKYCDLCLPLFSFEAQALEQRGVKSLWCGHPLMDDFTDFHPVPPALEFDPKRVAMLPGSRRSEITTLLPVMEETALRLKAQGLRPVFSIAPGLNEECKTMIRRNAYQIETTEISGRNLMHASRFVIGASGTTAVEAMLLNRYMIVLYKGTPLEWFIYKKLTHTPYVSIPNVLAGSMMYPELLQDDARTENILRYADRYLKDSSFEKQIHDQISENRAMMGAPEAADRWAEAISRLVRS